MFKPNADHIEELMRAKEICLTLADDMKQGTTMDTINLNIRRLELASNFIEGTLEQLSAEIEALAP